MIDISLHRAAMTTGALAAMFSLTSCDTGDMSAGEAPGGSFGFPSEASETALPQEPANLLGQARTSLDESRENAVVRAAERVSSGVVAVNVLRPEQVRTRDPFFDDFFGFFAPFSGFGGSTTTRLVPSLGSGFVIDASGVILTNDHVVRGAERILVTLPDGRDAEASLVGTDEATDVAVLRVDIDGLESVPLGRADDLRIGEWVIAFGNPFGHLLSNPEPSVTVGVASALGRHIVPSGQDRGSYLGMIQTDAAINPGNSGGPLVNADGEVIGMNTSIFSRSGGSEGMGFAVPIDRALLVAEDLLEFGEVQRAWIGLRVEPEVADDFGRTRGVRVASVVEGSPAAGAGIPDGARLMQINGVPLVTPLDFEAALLDLRAGDSVTMVTAGSPGEVRLRAEGLPSARAPRLVVFGGLEVVTVTGSIRSERNIVSQTGALVVGDIPTQTREILGLREGDVIVALNNRGVESAQDLSDILDVIPPGSRVRLTYERNGGFVAQDFIHGR
jgi:serine protease Do